MSAIICRFMFVVSSCAGLFGCGGCQPTSAQTTVATKGVDSEEPPARVTTVKPQRKILERRSEQPGEIAAFEETPLYAKVAGYVQAVNVDIGDRIKQGQALVVLSVPELVEETRQKAALVVQAQSQITQANAAVEVARAAGETALAKVSAAQAAISRTMADVERWKSETGRINELAEKSAVTRKVADETLQQLRVAEAGKLEAEAQVVSAKAGVVEAKAKLTAAKADVEAANARLAVAQADHDRAQVFVEYATIKAPYDGTVNQRLVHSGYYVQPATTGRDEPLLVVSHSDTVRVVVHVPEADAGLTKLGAPATIRVQSLNNKQFAGAVKRVASAMDEKTRTLRAEIDLENRIGELVPGMYCYATLVLGHRSDALVIPAAAVMFDQDKASCLVVDNGHIVRVPIETGIRTRAEVEVVSGLTGNEAVVPKNPANFHEGQRVETIN
jgi:HlyD family secretion protein